MRILKINKVWIICLLTFVSAFAINQHNLNQLPEDLIRAHQTIKTNDDVSYLAPAKNYAITGSWKDNSLGKQSYFNRPPGYGLFYYSLLNVFGESNALLALKIIQLILFSLSVFWLFSITHSIFKSKRTAYLVAILYGIVPFANGFLFYTLTEGISPALLLLYVYLLFKAHETSILSRKRILYFLASFTFAYLLLVRPALGLFGILIPVFLIRDYLYREQLKTLIIIGVYSLVAFSLTIIWQIRNYSITGKYVGLHAIYYEDNNSLYRPTFKAYWDFVGGWAQEGHEVHSYMLPMWNAAINGDISTDYIDNAIATFPEKVTQFYGRERLHNAFNKYQEATLYQKEFYDQSLPMPDETPPIELEVIDTFNSLTKDFKQKFWVDYYFIAPFNVFKTMAFHSNLSLYIFQHTYRGNYLIEGLRYFTYVLHSFCFIALLLSLFMKRMEWRLKTINWIMFVYVFYLCFFQRGIEERYTLPLLAFLLITSNGVIKWGLKKLRG